MVHGSVCSWQRLLTPPPPQDTQVDQSFNVMLCTTRVDPKKKDLFEIVTPDKKKPIVLQAESQVERDSWVKAINSAISESLNAGSAIGFDKSSRGVRDFSCAPLAYTTRVHALTHAHTGQEGGHRSKVLSHCLADRRQLALRRLCASRSRLGLDQLGHFGVPRVLGSASQPWYTHHQSTLDDARHQILGTRAALCTYSASASLSLSLCQTTMIDFELILTCGSCGGS